jgi:pimeloyl-ACP methyl ester carboxylesterase
MTSAENTNPSVVLVHGAYADGSSWSEVIKCLQDAGIAATAVQNPLTSLADDAEHTRRILALQPGPVILAGHSFAGTVITEAGTDPAVAALVYVAARAPDAGEDYAALAGRFPAPPASAGLVYTDGSPAGIARSRPSCSGSWPGAWTRRPSRSIPATSRWSPTRKK